MMANTDTNRSRRKAPSEVPAFACRTAHLGNHQGLLFSSEIEHPPLHFAQSEDHTPRQRRGYPQRGLGAPVGRTRGPIMGAPRTVCPAVDNPRRIAATRKQNRPPPHRRASQFVSPLDNSTHRSMSGFASPLILRRCEAPSRRVKRVSAKRIQSNKEVSK